MNKRLTYESYVNLIDAAVFMIPDVGSITKRSYDQKTASSFISFVLFQFCYIVKYVSLMQKICKAFLEVKLHSCENKCKVFFTFCYLVMV